MSRVHVRLAGLAAASLAVCAFGAPPAAAVARSSGAELNADADLRNLAVDEEIYLTDVGTHYGTFAQLAQDHVTVTRHSGVVLRIVHIESNMGYCLEATAGAHHLIYDSEAGGLTVGSHCVMTTRGPGGGTLGRASGGSSTHRSGSGKGKSGTGNGNLIPPPTGVRTER